VDGDHSYEGCAGDLDAWWPTLRSGGIMAGHVPRKGKVGLWDTVGWDKLGNLAVILRTKTQSGGALLGIVGHLFGEMSLIDQRCGTMEIVVVVSPIETFLEDQNNFYRHTFTSGSSWTTEVFETAARPIKLHGSSRTSYSLQKATSPSILNIKIPKRNWGLTSFPPFFPVNNPPGPIPGPGLHLDLARGGASCEPFRGATASCGALHG
jgi:hypothetical protein